MEKFRYLNSADHAKWYVPVNTTGVDLPSEILDQRPDLRIEIREWVERHCHGTVWAWNKTRTPTSGQSGWGELIAPQGDMVVFFERIDDRTLFQLTWT